MFSMVYLWYALTYGADAITYFENSRNNDLHFSFGSAGVSYLLRFFVVGFDVSILGGFLIFNVFGVVGLLAFYACCRTATQNKPRYLEHLATVIVFLPSVSFWSSAIGKDALSFMSTGLALWAALSLNKRWLLMIFAVAVMLLVRPHIAAMMLIGWILAILVRRKTPLQSKLVLGMLAVIATAVIIPIWLQHAGVGSSVDVEELMAYVEQRQGFNMEGGSSVDIASMSLPMQLFTYMFRPLIIEANTVFAFVSAIDNLILSFVFVVGAWALLQGRKSNLGESRAFMWTYALLVWLVLAMTTANLGIAMRQKWMFVPMLLFLFISVIGVKKRRKANHVKVPTKHHVANLVTITGRTR